MRGADDTTQPMPWKYIAVNSNETAVVSRFARPVVGGGHARGVHIDCRRGTLTVAVFPDGHVQWTYSPGGAGDPAQAGDDILWRFGRLTWNGPDARVFNGLRADLGITNGQIEAELRDLTRYVEGSE